MIDARRFIREKLLTVCDNVKMSRPDGEVQLPLICYAQVSNLPPSSGVAGLYTRLEWRIAIYDNAFEDLQALVQKTDAVMTGLGFTRTAMTDDDKARIGTDLYVCRLTYSALVHDPSLSVMPRTA